jgi:hypothetical protein
MKRIALVGIARNVLAPGWILVFGFVFLIAPPLGVAESLTLFLMGVVVVPALIVMPAIGPRHAPARTTHHIERQSRAFRRRPRRG